MKRTIVASLLGIAASVATVSSSYAQGRVAFNNYGATTYARVNYGAGSGGTVGNGLNNSFTAALYYTLGAATFNDPTGIAPITAPFGLLAGLTSTFSAAPFPAGYFGGAVANVPDYVSGPITFIVVAYNGADYASSGVRGHSAAFTLQSIATGLSPSGEFGPALTSFQVLAVPEPSTFALAGFGVAALLALRRRK